MHDGLEYIAVHDLVQLRLALLIPGINAQVVNSHAAHRTGH